MYLKSIEVQGFKSFANKTVFQFGKGITAIVGPNGSGKSNVADAVRWVLGEQSARTLRGSSMQDVIFAGTQTRRPLGFAEVALTLDNADHLLAVSYEEVTVKRRVYRSGESEYILNGAQVRLRDIQELFYDTGIGQEGYSIIGQGQIDRILSTRPEDLRELFDEAAGIVRYKRRKASALKKLENERANLTRVSDILSELDAQLEPLRKQSETAKIYLQKRDQLKALDVNLFLLENDQLQKDLQSLDEKQRTAREQLAGAQADYEKTRERYDSAEQEIAQLDASVQEKRDAAAESSLRREQLKNQIQLLQEQIRTDQAGDAHLHERLTAVSEQISALEAQEAQTLREREEQKEQQAQVRAAYADTERKAGEVREASLSLEGEIERKKSAIIDLLNQRSTVKAQKQRYETMSEQVRLRKAQIAQEMLRLKSEEAAQSSERGKQQAAYEKASAQIADLQAQTEKTSAALQAVQEELTGCSRKMDEERARCERTGSRLESLKNIAERYDGYGSSIRRVMERRPSEPGILGVVADLISVRKEYETAIETALGSSIQNIVTDTEETAKRQIEFLKKNRFGRATFLPLSGISSRGGFSAPQALEEDGVLGLASALVQTEPRYKVLADSLLGRTVVADGIDHAIALARKYRHSLRIVTLEGELLNPGGSMSGGAFKNSSSLLGRRREIGELEAEAEKSRRALDQLGEKTDRTRSSRNRLREELVRLNEETQQQSLAQNTARLRLDELNEKTGTTAQSFKRLEAEDGELALQLQEIAGNLEKEERELTQSECEEKQLESEIEKLQGELEEKHSEESEASAKVKETELALSKLEQQDSFLSQNLGRIRQEKAQLLKEKSEREEQIRSAAGSVREKEDRIAAIEGELSQMEEAQRALQQDIGTLTARREEVRASNKQFFTEREELSEKISLLDKENFRLQAQTEKLTGQRDARINYMWEEYGLTFSSAEELRDPSFTAASALQKSIAEVRKEIQALGDVNVNAVGQYKELLSRRTFLSSQREDLQKAEEALRKVIEDLNDGMRRQFEEQFALIAQEFDKSFVQLFGGGRGTLELEEGEDILEAGIRISVQPPGKKLQNMLQLSGGEKALSAIALLFAIQNLKPSPFCLLDEIEAALDESNVERYARYLRRLAEHTQFIIITHRRGAMNAADRLYGITMQEKGVSSLISVDLIESELDA